MTKNQHQVKNCAMGYSNVEMKVRKATSNKPWGPSSELKSEINKMTYDSDSLDTIMRIIWKRLDDSGKNWRHVYKSLMLLEFLVKNGNEEVAQQCEDHKKLIQKLERFCYNENNIDKGHFVCLKASKLLELLFGNELQKGQLVEDNKGSDDTTPNSYQSVSTPESNINTTSSKELTKPSEPSIPIDNHEKLQPSDPSVNISPGKQGCESVDTNAKIAPNPLEEGLQISSEIILSQQVYIQNLHAELAIILGQQGRQEEETLKCDDKTHLDKSTDTSQTNEQTEPSSELESSVLPCEITIETNTFELSSEQTVGENDSSPAAKSVIGSVQLSEQKESVSNADDTTQPSDSKSVISTNLEPALSSDQNENSTVPNGIVSFEHEFKPPTDKKVEEQVTHLATDVSQNNQEEGEEGESEKKEGEATPNKQSEISTNIETPVDRITPFYIILFIFLIFVGLIGFFTGFFKNSPP